MILAVDIGNTSTVAGLVESGSNTVVAFKRFATDAARNAKEYNGLFASLLSGVKQHGGGGTDTVSSIEGVIICSVVPVATVGMIAPLRELIDKPVYVVSTDGIDIEGATVVEQYMQSDVENRGEVGADRLVNAIAAFELFGGPVLVVDFGTALTLDYVNAGGVYCGGIIAPGIGISLEALHLKTAKLPLVSLDDIGERPGGRSEDVPNVVGRSSIESIKSGVYWGTVSMVDGMVERVRRERGVLKRVVATGGFAATVAGATDCVDEVDEFLTLKGLGLIYERKG